MKKLPVKDVSIPFETQTQIKKKGDAVKTRLQDGMMITVEKKSLAYSTGPGFRKPAVYLEPGMVGIVANKSAPCVTYNRNSPDPNKRRTTFCIVDFTGRDGEKYRCAPEYSDIIILPKKGGAHNKGQRVGALKNVISYAIAEIEAGNYGHALRALKQADK